ncbi:MAG: hypothetical protein PHP62_03270 [Candidatus Moranbacteria bacterium]|nr:hypothetical protein [Candidatus Moranbacteria bacterium]
MKITKQICALDMTKITEFIFNSGNEFEIVDCRVKKHNDGKLEWIVVNILDFEIEIEVNENYVTREKFFELIELLDPFYEYNSR